MRVTKFIFFWFLRCCHFITLISHEFYEIFINHSTTQNPIEIPCSMEKIVINWKFSLALKSSKKGGGGVAIVYIFFKFPFSRWNYSQAFRWFFFSLSFTKASKTKRLRKIQWVSALRWIIIKILERLLTMAFESPVPDITSLPSVPRISSRELTKLTTLGRITPRPHR